MPDFSSPEYESYVNLCVEERVHRRGRDGDWFLSCGVGEEPNTDQHLRLCSRETGYFSVPSHFDDWQYVWLPQVHDWVEMIEKEGRTSYGVYRRHDLKGAVQGDGDWWYVQAQSHDLARLCDVTPEWPDRGFLEGGGPTLEEALARFWTGVTRRA